MAVKMEREITIINNITSKQFNSKTKKINKSTFTLQKDSF